MTVQVVCLHTRGKTSAKILNRSVQLGVDVDVDVDVRCDVVRKMCGMGIILAAV